MAIKLWKKIPVNIRRWIIGIIFWIVSILSAFAVGTIYPNKWIVNKLETDVTKRVQNEWKQYGLELK